ncbi:unnamed protein product, partial [marine sediment metagenome]
MLPYMKWYPSEVLGDPSQQILSNEAAGVYHRLLWIMWHHNEKREKWEGIPADDSYLAALVREDPG